MIDIVDVSSELCPVSLISPALDLAADEVAWADCLTVSSRHQEYFSHNWIIPSTAGR